jgi:hypothetical protein
MFGINYIKFESMTYVILYKNGKIVKEGKGLSFFYYAPNSSIVAIPMGSSDINFIFTETTSDFQEVSIQGNITYKIENPQQLAQLLDYTVNESGNYKKNDFEKLNERLVNEAQTATSSFIRELDLVNSINSSKELSAEVYQNLKDSNAISELGITPLRVSILAIKATPETKKALESKAREELLKKADLAIYERRNFSVEQERMIKQSELNTEIAIVEKEKEIAEKQMERDVAEAENDRKIREMKVQADFSIETQRKDLMDIQVVNEKKSADAKGYAIEAMIKPYRSIDWRQIAALNPQSGDPANNIALAFRELAENAGKIGTLNISPDLIETLIKPKTKR